MPLTRLQIDKENYVEIDTHGAHVVSWMCKGEEQLFVSSLAEFGAGKAIRGGIPVIFPQFGAFGPGQKHGFARNLNWDIANICNDSHVIEYALGANEETLSIWPYHFEAKLRVQLLESKLEIALIVENTGVDTIEFTSALHTYFRVNDIANVTLNGVEGLNYWDNGTEFNVRATQQSNVLKFDNDIDRVYFDCKCPLQIVEGGSSVKVESHGFNDVVVWNPWQEGAKSLADMDNDGYKYMLCVESATVEHPTKVAPGESWVGKQILSVG